MFPDDERCGEITHWLTGARLRVNTWMMRACSRFRRVLSSEVQPEGQPKLIIHFRNASSTPFDIVEMGPLFLEIQVEPGRWRTAQHPRWGSLEIDTMFTFAPDHDESETEPVSAFTELGPGNYRVRVSMVFDRGMATRYSSDRLWTGVIRSNTVEIFVPEPTPMD